MSMVLALMASASLADKERMFVPHVLVDDEFLRQYARNYIGLGSVDIHLDAMRAATRFQFAA